MARYLVLCKEIYTINRSISIFTIEWLSAWRRIYSRSKSSLDYGCFGKFHAHIMIMLKEASKPRNIHEVHISAVFGE